MNNDLSQAQAAERFTAPLLEKLKRHPKRVVFTEGEDPRVLRVAERLVKEEAVIPILLGSKEKIQSLAKEEGTSLKFVNVIEPRKSSDFELFCSRFQKIERYRNHDLKDVSDFVARPHYFGALMVQYGHADALVGGNVALPATLFRAILHSIKPMPNIPRLFGVTVLSAPHLEHFGDDGLVFLADCGLIPEPDINQLATMAVETGKLARHFLGRPAKVALLSHSTKGSAGTEQARKVDAATIVARDRVSAEYLEMKINGEIQADVAMDPEAAEVKVPGAGIESSDVLIFPNLDAAHISMKLLQHCAGAMNYGQLLVGLARPVAQVPRTTSDETLFGTAAAVAVEAIKFHMLFPDGEV